MNITELVNLESCFGREVKAAPGDACLRGVASMEARLWPLSSSTRTLLLMGLRTTISGDFGLPCSHLTLLLSGPLFSWLLMPPPAFLPLDASTQFGFAGRISAVGGVEAIVDKFFVLGVACACVVVIKISSLS
jgi:hypothetical protein